MTGARYGYVGEPRSVTCRCIMIDEETGNVYCGGTLDPEGKKPMKRCVEVPMVMCQNLFVPIDPKTGKKLKPRFVE